MLSDALISDLAKATAAWLSFHALCGLDGLLSESALNIPVGTFIGTRSGARISAEFDHPTFRNLARGRPKQIDYVLRNANSKVTQAIECKWSNVGVQSVVNDIYRLECLGVERPAINDPFAAGINVSRLFLIAGTAAAMTNFSNKGVNTGGGRTQLRDFLLSFDLGAPERRFNVDTAHTNIKGLVAKFENNYYGQNTIKIPKIIVTKLVASASDHTFQVHVWKINRANGTGKLTLQGVNMPSADQVDE